MVERSGNGPYDLIEEHDSNYDLVDSEGNAVLGRMYERNPLSGEQRPVEQVEEETVSHMLMFEDSEEDEIAVRALGEAMHTRTRSEVQTAAVELAREQFGLAEDAAIPELPDWITDEALLEGEAFADENNIVVFLPAARLINRQPDLEMYASMRPAEQSLWLRMRYDDDGILNAGGQLVEHEDDWVDDSPVPNEEGVALRQEHDGTSYVTRFIDSEEDEAIVRALRDGMNTHDRQAVESTAWAIARAEYGIAADVEMPSMPAWITDEILGSDDSFQDGDAIVVFVPSQELVAGGVGSPQTELYRGFDLTEGRGMWLRFKYDSEGIISGSGKELRASDNEYVVESGS